LYINFENDSEGVMQDTHWPSGLFGYFPTYTLGNIYSGQLLAKMTEKMPDWRNSLAQGNLRNVVNWLVQNVHSQSNLYDPGELIKKATGQELNGEAYLDYLNEKYSKVYGF
jgi:carboxypeptidase Taq